MWGSWCGPCIEEAPALEQVASDLREAGEPVRFIGVNSRDSVPSALAFQQAVVDCLVDRTRRALGRIAPPTALVAAPVDALRREDIQRFEVTRDP